MNSHGFGAVAQLGERLPCTQEVRSSILLGSTINLVAYAAMNQNYIRDFPALGLSGKVLM